MTKESRDLVTIDISEDTIEEIIAIGNDVAIWAKVVDGGFSANDKTVPEIIGNICGISPYLVKWEGKQPHKIPHVVDDSEIPEGYERRVDLKILIDGQIVGVSLSKSSFIFQLSPYIRHLKNNGLRPEDVVTRLRTKQVSNLQFSFNIVIFEMLGSTKNATAKKVGPQSGPDQGTPPAVPQSASVQETPSAIPPEWA